MRLDIVELIPNQAYRLDGYEGYTLSVTNTVPFSAVLEGQVQANLETAPLALEWLTLDSISTSGLVSRASSTPFIRVRLLSGSAKFLLQKLERFVT